MTFRTRRAAGVEQRAHLWSLSFAPPLDLLHSPGAPGPAPTLAPPSLSLPAPAQVLAVGQGGLRVRGSQLCKCFQLLCDWSWVLLFDPTPRQARPRLFLAAAGDERMSA